MQGLMCGVFAAEMININPTKHVRDINNNEKPSMPR
jgi:hypothetical protein